MTPPPSEPVVEEPVAPVEEEESSSEDEDYRSIRTLNVDLERRLSDLADVLVGTKHRLRKTSIDLESAVGEAELEDVESKKMKKKLN